MKDGLLTDDEVREMYKDDPEELAWALEMNAETRRIVEGWDEALDEISALRELTAEMIADEFREEGEELQQELGEVEGQKELDRRKEAQAKAFDILPWRKFK